MDLKSAILENGLVVKVGDTVYQTASQGLLYNDGDDDDGFCRYADCSCMRKVGHPGPHVLGFANSAVFNDDDDGNGDLIEESSVKITAIKLENKEGR